jgi:choline dehydrogenase-like flavoprotein
VDFTPYGEMVPNRETFVDLDHDHLDEFGLPTARRHLQYGENDWKLFHDMLNWSQQILEAAGAEILSVPTQPATNHELGGCRMGSDPRTSVVNADCRTHDVPNLYIVDGSVFPSASEKNPTHTIMALAARTADHLAGRLSRGEL